MAKDFLTWLNDELRDRGWSNSELHRRSGMATSTISMILGGQKKPGWDFCAAVAQALGEPPDKLFRMAGLLPSIPASNALEAELLHHFRQLDEEQRRTALALLKALKGR